MPTVTQTRVIAANMPPDQKWPVGQIWLAGTKRPTSWVGSGARMVDGSQTTTSFRGNERSDYESFTGVELRRNLHAQYKREFDTGHDFSSTKTWFEYPTGHLDITAPYLSSPAYSIRYVGPLWTSFGYTPQFPGSASGASDSSLLGFGRSFIANTVPNQPEVSLAAMLGELRESIPREPGHAFFGGRWPTVSSVGEEHLNYQFGLLPTGSDLGKLAYAITQFHTKLKQLRRDSDERNFIRRKARLAQTREVTAVNVTNISPPEVWLPRMDGDNVSSSFFGTSASSVTHVTEKVQDVWFSGAYQFHLAEAHDFLGKMERYEQLAQQLLGTRLTPDVVWELTPWSWLIDWVSDANIFMKNISLLSADSTVMRYGYVMCKTHWTLTRSVSGLSYRPGSTAPRQYSCKLHRETKQRIRATPYGFGLDLSRFTGRQWSILAALGMTRGNSSLKRSG